MLSLNKIFKMLKWQRQIRAALSTQLSMLEGDASFAFGGLQEEELVSIEYLVKMAAEYPGPVIEFGTLFGITTKLMASVAVETQTVISVDNFCWNPFGLSPELHEAFTRSILRSELHNQKIELIVSPSNEFRSNYSGHVPSMVFFDADHSYHSVKDEIQWAKACGVTIISGHDYGNERFGVTRAVDEEFPEGVESAGMVWWKQA